MVSQTKQYQMRNLQGIDRLQRFLKLQKGPNFGQNGGKNTKSSILRPICHLEHCKSINGQKNGYTNDTIL